MSQYKKTEKYDKANIKHVFDFIRDANQNGIVYEGKTCLIKASFPADMSCHWKVTGLGGACKVSTYFCHLCGCTSNDCEKIKKPPTNAKIVIKKKHC